MSQRGLFDVPPILPLPIHPDRLREDHPARHEGARWIEARHVEPGMVGRGWHHLDVPFDVHSVREVGGAIEIDAEVRDRRGRSTDRCPPDKPIRIVDLPYRAPGGARG